MGSDTGQDAFTFAIVKYIGLGLKRLRRAAAGPAPPLAAGSRLAIDNTRRIGLLEGP